MSRENASWGPWQEVALLLPETYAQAVWKAGGAAVLIPPDPRLEHDPETVVARLDALVLTGGADVDPARYGEAPHSCLGSPQGDRDSAETGLLRAALARDVPVLAICRGMQILNVELGGTLVQHLPDVVGHDGHLRRAGRFERHVVRLLEGSLAEHAAGERIHKVRSHHHQAIDRVGNGVRITGWSIPDEVPEALELPGQRFVLGVQWHPEEDERSRLLGAVVEVARSAARV